MNFDTGARCTEFIKKIFYWKSTTSRHIAPRRKKHEMMLFGEFVTAGNERAHRLATDGAMSVLDGGETAQIRASTVQQRREEVYAALPCAASFHCLVEEWQDGEEFTLAEAKRKVGLRGQHRTEWCAAASKHGRSSEQMNMRRTCEGSRWLGMDLNHKFGR